MLEIEQHVLGCLLLHAGTADKVGSLKPGDFSQERHSTIFRAIHDLHGSGKPHDLISVQDWLHRFGILKQIGGHAYLTELTDCIPFVSSLENHSSIIRKRARGKKVAEHCELYLAACRKGQSEDADVFLHSSISKIMDGHEDGGWVSLGDAAKEALDDTIEASKRPEGTGGGLSTGIASLDDALGGGIHAPDLIVIGARPSMGKTAIALTMAVASKVNVGFFSLEMQDKQLASRYLSGVSGVNTSAMRTGKIKDEQWSKLAYSVGKAKECKVWLDDTPGLDVNEIKSRAVQLQTKHGLDLLIVDYLQLATAGIKGNRVQDVSEVSRKLKEIAKLLNVPVIALAQLNRQLEQRTDKRPVLSDLRESGQLEQDADVIMFLYRDWVYNKDSDPAHAEAIIGKFRNGQPQTVNMEFIPEQTTFRDW